MSEDLIKREDAIEALYKYSFVSKDVIEKEIKAIPSADRPQGEWKEHWYPHFDVAGIECSICSKDVPYWERNYDMPRYCPNCRAKMKGADDEV
ncbi:MAG: hypothetical protein J5965_15180 [Aeriscardovia sp.]|nr:hypothetical protein [Aeriscardovia sp.]